jgi:hypothetical protein
MNETQEPRVFLSIQDAAERAGRSIRTIEIWITEGMPVVVTKNRNGTVIRRQVAEDDLMTHKREKMLRNPSARAADSVTLRLTTKHAHRSLPR